MFSLQKKTISASNKNKNMYTLSFILVQLISLTSAIAVGKTPDIIGENSCFAEDEKYVQNIYSQINDKELNFEALKQALKGYNLLRYRKILNNNFVLTIIDYSKPSNTERFFVIDINNKKLLYKSLVAHGKNSGVQYARNFSNKQYSFKSSIGFFLTGETYYGKHGFSLRLNGLEKDINDNAKERSIVIHSASYVNEEYIKKYGRLGRSRGCPALPAANFRKIVEAIKNKTCLFIYYPDKKYLGDSEFINNSGEISVN
jgi:hypothetical protein